MVVAAIDFDSHGLRVGHGCRCVSQANKECEGVIFDIISTKNQDALQGLG